jgi:TolA-binding protein
MKYIFAAILLSIVIIGCSKTTDQNYMKKAAESVKQNNISDAVQAYENLVKDYPDSKLAPKAILEEAALYQNGKVKNLSGKEALQKAANLYESVFDKYPQNEQAPKALFMSGFIEANDLKDFNKATELYKLFLEKYPKHQLAESAKEELKNMGLSPEQILQKNSKNQNI